MLIANGELPMTVRVLLSSLVLGAALTAAACATPPGPGSNYSQDMARLTADCAERGGILVPIPGSTSGRPEADNACEIRGGSSRIRD